MDRRARALCPRDSGAEHRVGVDRAPDQIGHAAAAAAWPLFTAPSIVAGRPVPVQSPARKKSVIGVTGPGRSASFSGVQEKVARFSLITAVRTTFASAPAGEALPSSPSPRATMASLPSPANPRAPPTTALPADVPPPAPP